MRILKNRPRPEDPQIHPQGAYPDRRGPMQPRTRSSAAGRVPRLSLILAHLSLCGLPGVQNADSHAPKAFCAPPVTYLIMFTN